ncbi:MAG TPA: type 1 periplasmic binding fold superfamily protein [Microscillaceae bacterium]|jgi:hypothetical protein|nr:type 1 periplasmic binding fold superfamily protein [Microscillaceae bacterium]
MYKFTRTLLLLWMVGVAFTSCRKKNDPKPENPEEEINRLVMTFTPVAGGAPIVFRYEDLDGPGGNAPVLTNPPLQANRQYNVAIQVFKVKSTGEVEEKTPEVLTEGDEHQFFFRATAGLNLTFSYTDVDKNQRPIGLSTRFTTGNASSGSLTVILRHELNKAAAGVAAGDATNAGGETDIETTPPFAVTIQ